MTSTKPTLVARATSDTTDTITTLAMSSRFTPPASCSSSWTYEPFAANDVEGGLLLQNAVASDNADPNCFPSGYSQYERVQPSIIYSPGYCPVGYTSANLVIHDPVTTAICCPSNFDYLTILTNVDKTYAGCTSMLKSKSSTIVTVRQVTDESTQVFGPITMWAQPIQVELQASDLSLFVSATTTSGSAGATGSSGSSTQSGATSTSTSGSGRSDTTASDAKSGLSTGASVGIGVGVGVGALIIIAGLAFWLFRRRQAKKNLAANPSYQSVNPEASELGGSSQAAPSSTPANTNTTASELDTNQAPKPIHELDA